MTDLVGYDFGGMVCTPAETSAANKGTAERRLGSAGIVPSRQWGGTGAEDGSPEETAEGQVAEQSSADIAVALRRRALLARDRGTRPQGGPGGAGGCGLAEAPAEVAGLAACAVRGTVPGARRGGVGVGQLPSAGLRRHEGAGAGPERLAVAHALQRAPAVVDVRLLQADADGGGGRGRVADAVSDCPGGLHSGRPQVCDGQGDPVRSRGGRPGHGAGE